MEHLAACRTKAAGKLAKKVGANGKEVRSSLKEAGKFAEVGLDAGTSRNVKTKEKRKIREQSANSMASSFDIEQELRAWPKLNAKNIHPFRLKVKEWRYVLQLGQESDSRLLDELGRVKDQIGLWHDWNELSGIAAKAFDHGPGCSVMAQIRSRTKKEFEKALETANAFRAQYLPTEERRARKKGVVTEIHPAVARATSRLASAS
jgi:CHAD domain-containing protein